LPPFWHQIATRSQVPHSCAHFAHEWESQLSPSKNPTLIADG
jgi:hypothetical protein